MKALSRITLAIALSISPLMVWYCSCRSAKGTGINKFSLAQLEQSRRVPGIAARRHDVPGYHRTGTDDHIVDDPYRHDRGIRSDRNPVADDGLAPKLLFSACRRPGRKRVVDEHHAMADEAILPDRHQLADERMRLHPGARADD